MLDLDKLFDFVAPHPCFICQKTGQILCSSCKNHILENANSLPNLFTNFPAPFKKVWCVDTDQGDLGKLIKHYKYHPAPAAAYPLSDLLNATLPILPDDTIIVPIPTIRPHIRQRGFDHTLKIAKILAKKRNLKVLSLLKRAENSVQVGSTAAQRRKNAKVAFNFNESLVQCSRQQPILLLDDVYTTGSTVLAAADLLKKSGFKTIYLALLARHKKPAPQKSQNKPKSHRPS